MSKLDLVNCFKKSNVEYLIKMTRRIGILLLACFTIAQATDDGNDIPTVYAVVGDIARIPCNVSTPLSDDEASLILWYRSDFPNPIYTLDIRSGPLKSARHFPSLDMEGKIHFDVSVHPPMLVLTSVQPAHAAEYKCRVDLRRSRTLILHSVLVVIVPPREPIIMDEHGQRLRGIIGPYDEGSNVELICDVDGGYPSPSVTWWQGQRLINDDYNVTTQGFVRNILVLTKIQRSDLMSEYTCRAWNTNLTKARSASIRIDMNLLPLKIKISSFKNPMQAGDDHNVSCETIGSKPPPVTTWWLNKKKLDPGPTEIVRQSSNISVSIFSFRPAAEDNGKRLICKSSNPTLPNSTILDYMILRVNFIPILNISLSLDAMSSPIQEGSDVIIECHIRSRPWIFEVTWQFEGQIISENKASGMTVRNQTLLLKNVRKSHRGHYRCLASNSVGQGSSEILFLLVQFTPACRSSYPMTYGVAKSETVNVTCDVEADPENVIFRWSLINTLETRILQNWSTNSSQNFLNYSPRTDDDYGMLSCWGRNSVGIQMDPCVFKIVPAGPPDSPHECLVSNQTLNYLSVECSPGYNGSLSQTFHLEVYNSVAEKMVYNLTASDRPNFKLGKLLPNTAYVLVIYASNVKGRSESVAIVTTTSVPLDKSVLGSQKFAALLPALLVLVGVLTFSCLVGGFSFIIVRLCQSTEKKKDGGLEIECETEKKEVEESQDTSEKGPDIIPLSADSEVFITVGLTDPVQFSPHHSSTSKESVRIKYMHTVL